MRILIVNHYAGSLSHGMEYRPYYFAQEWIRRGHEIDIIAADFSHLRKENPHVTHNFQQEDIDGIRYHWIRTIQYQGNGLRRAVTMFQFTAKLWLRAKKIAKMLQPDVVIASSTYPLDTYPARKIARYSHAKEIHEVHDMWPATLIELGGMSPKHPFVRILQRAENTAYKKSDAVVSLLPCAKEYMVRHGLDPKKFHYIPNGIVLSDWEKPEPLPPEHMKILQKFKNDNKVIVCYFGGFALSNNLDLILDTAALLKLNEKIVFCLVGKGTEKERLINRKMAEHLDNVFFLPPVNKRTIPLLLSQIDIICICSKKSPLYKYGVSMNKVYDAMMSRRPIVSAFEVPNDDIKTCGCGISVPADDPQAFAEAIADMSNLSQEMRDAMGDLGYQTVIKNYDYNKLSEKFLDVVSGL